VSVAVVTVLHDSAAELPPLLYSLARCLPDARVIAVDSGSTDDGAARAAAAGAEVIDLGDNVGFGAANNAGVERVAEDVTVLINPDCELLDGGVGGLVVAARSNDALFAPRLVGADGAVEHSAHFQPGTVGSLAAALVHPPLLGRAVAERLEPWRATRARTVGWAVAACLVARTTTLRTLGPFDPHAFLFYEDLDLCLRARACDIPTVFVPEATVRHRGAHSTGPAYGGEPHVLLARRRREVVRSARGPVAAAIDEAGQILTFATRWAARTATGRDGTRAAAQLRAQLTRRP
jgi:GT2 family glycosyltransferase